MNSIAALIFCLAVVGAADFHLATVGNDVNDGLTLNSPWQTLVRLNAALSAGLIRSGDRVLFRSGDSFAGQIALGRGFANLTFATYAGPRPARILGSIEINALQQCERVATPPFETWRCLLDSALNVSQVFVNGRPLFPARHPNSVDRRTTFAIVQQLPSASEFVFAKQALPEPCTNLSGANFHARPVEWAFKHGRIADYRPGYVRLFDALGELKVEKGPGFGFYVDDMRQRCLLDAPDEFVFFDGKLEFLLGEPLSSCSVHVTLFDNGLLASASGTSNVTVRNLRFENQVADGISFLADAKQITIESCEFYRQGGAAVTFRRDASNLMFANNTVESVGSRGVYIGKGSDVTVANNTIRNVGWYAGYGQDAATMAGLTLGGTDRALVYNNTILNTGGNGIIANGRFNRIVNNHVGHAMMYLSDGGLVYMSGSNGDYYNNTVSGNLLHDSHGSLAGGRGTGTPGCPGVYLDRGCSGNAIANNSVSNVPLDGIKLSTETSNNVVSYNVISNASRSGVAFTQDTVPVTIVGNVVANNVFFNTTNAVYVTPKVANSFGYARFFNNTFSGAQTITFLQGGSRISSAQWSALYGYREDDAFSLG
eukprot:TRINITY_DN8766_c0_g1_i1.p1 TRINITY_DN8766_c0_g1~~TRINITY_DN8766_c0_g1_i1.p1  ORF type:complete len:598 (-),score=60.23 TRINITY_DN8766_c0_g1_i1:799-2592(-)